MTNYTNAPACKLLATNCCVCSRPLLDAVSVEMGIGPDCRKKYMGKLEGPARIEANKIVHQLALVVSGCKPELVEGLDTQAVQAAYMLGGKQAVGAMLAANHTEGSTLLGRLRTLGFDKLADKFEKAWLPIRITREGTNLLVETPYNEAATTAWYGINGSFWDKARKLRVVPVGSLTLNGPDTNSGKLWALLQRFYPGMAGIGTKGPFVVKAPAPQAVMMKPLNTTLTMAQINAQEDAREARKMAYIEAEGDRAGTLRDEYAKALAKGML